MVKRNIEGRLAAAERRLLIDKPTLHEVIFQGGLVPGIYPQAKIGGGPAIKPEADEDFTRFQQRMRALAQSAGARLIVYGGLPDNPTDWVTPPGVVEALAPASPW
jgi:hypothetical protein